LFFFFFISAVFSCREGRLLVKVESCTATGGKVGRLCTDSSEWTFDCIVVAYPNSIVTPEFCNVSHTNNIGCSGSVSFNLNEDEMIFDSSDDDSLDTLPDAMQRNKAASGNHIVHFPSLVLKYLHETMNVREWHREWKKQHEENHNSRSLTVEDTSYGLATNITIKCERFKEAVASIEATKIK